MNRKEVEGIIRNLGAIRHRIEGKKVLVTGGAGFLGSWICEVLVEQGAKVICLDNLVSGLKTNIDPLMDNANFTFIPHDITQPIFFDDPLDIILHLASRASPFEFEKYPIQILKANTLGIWIALGIAKKHNARFLYTSTSEVYGDATEIPTSEEYRGNVNPIGQRSCYDEAKRCGESYVIAYKMEHGLDVRIARIFNTYGPRMRAEGVYGRVIPRFVEQALSNKPLTIFGDGTQTRSFCYVTDQIEGLLKLAFLDEESGLVVNIGNDEEIPILELANVIKELTQSESETEFHPLPKDDPLRRRPDITKAQERLGWAPKVSLREGLERTIRYFREKK
ncbi:MAG: SDR family oxidoreductase [Methanophagales archaeon]|nr:SDR family oxidoreductase [Methanophagales archaeon]